ncbi:N-methyl-L-tryptophan oxidase [Streptomyces sp. NPDC001914]|uniref:N-methyl-L-tryptophan oxidase n=1 Tax=Streptomyces sp. NPDC001914 TaxID=3364623 RepID=UPI0036CF8FA4
MEDLDIVIIGAGVWGSSAAAQLARRGHSVLALDRWTPPHANGSHSGRTRLARQSMHEGAGYVPLSSRAFEVWAEYEAEYGVQILRRDGALLVDKADGMLNGPSLESLVLGGWEHEVLTPGQAMARFPALQVADDETALWEPGGRVLLVDPALEVLHKDAARHGATFALGERALSWRVDGEGVTVTTDRRTLRAGRLLITAGVYGPDLIGLDVPLQVERQILVTWEAGPELDGYPMLLWTDAEFGPRSGAYGCPEPGGHYKFALHHEGVVGHPDDLDRTVHEADLKAMTDVLARRLPGLTRAPTAATTCMYTNTPDHGWVFDRHPAGDQVVYATGDSGRSFRYAPAIGEGLADLVEGKDRPDLAFLRPDRFVGAGE